MKIPPQFVGRSAALAAALTLSIFLGALGQTSRAALVDGLRNYWSFEDDLQDKAATIAGSASTVADNGTFAGAAGAYTTGQTGFGKAILTNGAAGNADSHVIVPDSADVSYGTTDVLSMSGWFLVNAFDYNWQAIIAKGEGNEYRLARSGGNNTIGYAGGNTDITSPANVATGWHHFVTISDAANGTFLYVDGANLVNNPNAADIIDRAQNLLIGANPQGNAGTHSREWNGLIDDVAMWDRRLTEPEIAELYNGGVLGKPLSQLLLESSVDTDGDGLPDDWEIAKLGAGAENDNGTTNPNFGASGDPDADGSPNSQEFARNTDPLDEDSDDDLLKDGVETGTGFWDSITETGTDPRNPDSDGDTLSDGVENPDLPFTGPTQTGSDPNIVDTDMDTYPDDVEVAAGTDPNNAGDFPGATNLPIVDDFEDGDFNEIVWLKDTAIVAGGAAVVEEAGHMRLTGRGHFYTRDQYDPVAEGGLYIKGKWTYAGGDDFLQILTRSDGLPDPGNCCGETRTGIEFFANQPGSVGIRARGGEVALTGNQAIGDIVLRAGTTYEFYIIDDGTGNVGFCIWEDGNRANAEGVSDVVTAAAATSNHVVFHNREGARTSYLEEVEIGVLTDSDSDGMPDFWERDNGLVVGVNDAGLDKDMDGVPNGVEFLLCLDPSADDTDGDGLLDGEENDSGTFVSLTNTGTDPLDRDTDNDGLLDKVETNTGNFVSATDTGTDPFVADTDSDGTSDGQEVALGRNPLNAGDAASGVGIGLVAYWTFDDTLEDIAHDSGVGASVVPDIGAFTGPDTDVGYTADGLFGSALTLNGEEGWVTVPKSVDTIGNDTTKSVTVSTWFKAAAFDTSWQALVAHGEGSYWRIARNGNSNPGTIAYRGGTNDPTSTSTFATPTGWVHVVGQSDGTTSRLWINGVQEATGNGVLNTDLAAAADLFIGNNSQSAARQWEGDIDDLAIWNRALTATDIGLIYAGGAGGSLGELLGITGGNEGFFRITAIDFDTTNGMYSLTWNSKPSERYRISYGTDLNAWLGDVDDGIEGDPSGSNTIMFPQSSIFGVDPAAKRIFFRIVRED